MEWKMARSEFHFICRLCVQQLEKKNVFPLFSNESLERKISLPEKIKFCSSVEINEGDGLPSQICSKCLYKLSQSFRFRNQCVLADITLKHLVTEVNSTLEMVPNLSDLNFEDIIIDSSENFQTVFKAFNKIDTLKPKKEAKKLKEEVMKNELLNEFENSDNNCQGTVVSCDSDMIKNEPETLAVNDLHDTLLNSVRESAVYKKRHKSMKTTHTKRLKMIFEEKNMGQPNKHIIGLNANFESKFESFTVKPDVYAFSEICKDQNQNKSEEFNFNKYQKKYLTKSSKLNPLGIKKGKAKKADNIKQKQSSYTCSYCHKVYPSEGGWRYHIYTMHNENYQPFICDLCGQSFKVKKNLEGHKNSVHFHLKLNLCDLCGRGFASKYALKVHKIWHSDVKNFACDICGTKFRTRGKLNTHKTIHGGPKKFMCHICSRNFRWKKDFEVHMRTHTGEKPFACSHCGKAFASLTNKRKHERNHLKKIPAIVNGGHVENAGIVTSAGGDGYNEELLDLVFTNDVSKIKGILRDQ